MSYGLFTLELPGGDTKEAWRQRKTLNSIVKNIKREKPGGYNYFRVYRKASTEPWTHPGKTNTHYGQVDWYQVLVLEMTEEQVLIFKDLGYDVHYSKVNMNTKRRRRNYKRLR